MIPRSGRTDPSTSREAATRKAESGTLDTDIALFVRLVKEHPGCSIKELASWITGNGYTATEQERQRLSRRAGDVFRLKLAHPSGKCETGRLWWPGPEPEEAQQGTLFEQPTRYETD